MLVKSCSSLTGEMGKRQNSRRGCGKGQREELCRNGACLMDTTAVHLLFPGLWALLDQRAKTYFSWEMLGSY